TGLGLPIVKEIAEAHGGSISVTSQVNKGSIFTLCVPAPTHQTVSVSLANTPRFQLPLTIFLFLNRINPHLPRETVRDLIAAHGAHQHMPSLEVMDTTERNDSH